MIPDLPNLSPTLFGGDFVLPYNRDKEPLVDYARGGVNINDPSKGLDVKDWKIELLDSNWTISSEGSPNTVITSIPTDAIWVSLTFDQNMNPVVAYAFGDSSYLYWFDASVASYVTSKYQNASCPIVRMDDVREGANSSNDIILSYIKNQNLYIRIQSDRYGVEYELAKGVGNKLLQAGMSRAMRFQWKTTVAYPETLPCPQADMDLKPRERRYLSDIGDVRNMRMFQQEFQATHNKINFIFTEEEAAEFRDWYENVLVYGGAWFYADWPLLHKDKEIAHRFVGQPKWEWIYGGNPGKLGRSKQGGGFTLPDDAVTVYKVSATIEIYDRKIENFYASKIYPLYISEDITTTHAEIEDGRMPPKLYPIDDISASHISIPEASMKKWIYSNYAFSDDISTSHISIHEASMKKWIYSNYAFSDDISTSHISITGASTRYEGKIPYNKFSDDIEASHITIIAGEMT